MSNSVRPHDTIIDFSPKRTRRRYTASLTPLIDILFLLIVFFLLSSHFLRTTTLDVALPGYRVDEASRQAKNKQFIIYLPGDFQFSLQGSDPVTDAIDTLGVYLKKQDLHVAETEFVIVNTEETSVQELVAAMDIMKSLGAETIALVKE